MNIIGVNSAEISLFLFLFFSFKNTFATLAKADGNYEPSWVGILKSLNLFLVEQLAKSLLLLAGEKLSQCCCLLLKIPPVTIRHWRTFLKIV